MYPNLRAEMARKGITQKKLLLELFKEGVKISDSTLNLKLNGKNDFTFPEALAVKNVVCPEMPLEEMFAV